MPVRNHALGPLTADGSSIYPLHWRVGAAFVKENQLVDRNAGYAFGKPPLPFFPDIRPVPFFGDRRFFFRVIFMAASVLSMVA